MSSQLRAASFTYYAAHIRNESVHRKKQHARGNKTIPYKLTASKGNQVLVVIRRNITYKEKGLIVPLYKAIVRPHLEYCIQAWSPYIRKDIDMLEKLQRKATKLIPGLRDIRYEERLKECGLTTLETRTLRWDQIEVFNIQWL